VVGHLSFVNSDESHLADGCTHSKSCSYSLRSTLVRLVGVVGVVGSSPTRYLKWMAQSVAPPLPHRRLKELDLAA